MNRDAARAGIERWYRAALAAVDPEPAVRRVLTSGRVPLPKPARGRVLLLAIGKAADPMARAALGELGPLVATGIVVTKDGHLTDPLPPPLEGYEAAHPVPDERGVAATRRALAMVRSAGPGDLVLALISGGGSALFEAPRPPVTLADLAATTDFLLRSGAPIQHLNAVRTPLSLVKGGGLRAAAPGARFATLVLSDVLGNDLRTIASGPTFPGTRDPEAALALLDRYGARDQVPSTVVEALLAMRDAPKGPDAAPGIDDVAVVVGDNQAAVGAAKEAVLRDGLRVAVAWTASEGEARELGRAWVATCREAASDVDVVLGGGEATVTVRGDGIGGRNTEFALAAAFALRDGGGNEWVVASLATDGQDGPSGAAGAIADAETVVRSRAAGVAPEQALTNNDSAAVFEAAGGLVAPGPTGTNVCDLYFGVRVSS